jgi:hypothetical protein
MKEQIDPFDDLDQIRMPAEVVSMNAFKAKSGRKRDDVDGLYAMVPLPFIVEMAKSTGNLRLAVMIHLLCWLRLKGNPVSLKIGQLKALGVSPRTAYRALEHYAALGVISVSRNSGRATTVTFLREVYR